MAGEVNTATPRAPRPARTQRRTFVALVVTFLSVQALIVGLSLGALELFNGARAYTTGESFYAKGQKQAVYALQRYAYRFDPLDYEDYQRGMRVPHGDRDARVALSASPPDLETARQGFLQGRNHPDDVPDMIRLFRWFGDTPLFGPAIDVWAEGDAIVAEIDRRAEQLHRAIEDGSLHPAERGELLEDVHRLDREITDRQDEFSRILGSIVRLTRTVAIAAIGFGSLLLWAAGFGFAFRLHRRSEDAELALAQREQRLSAVMDSTADGILAVAFDGTIESGNRAVGQLLGRDVGDLVHTKVEQWVTPDDRPAFVAALEATTAGHPRERRPQAQDLAFFSGDGSVVPVDVTFTLLEGFDRARAILTLRDMTERRETEAQLRQAQKMEAVGQLTGGLAHDFNNLLAVILGNLELLALSGAANSMQKQAIATAIGATERGARLTGHLLAFSRRQALRPRATDVDALVVGMRDLIVHTMRADIEVQLATGAEGARAMVDPGQLESALLNLVINARHAMTEGGRLRVETALFSSGDAEAGVALGLPTAPGQVASMPSGPPDEYVVVSVIDTGVGIPPEHQEKVFEPFFTTKEVGKGSGLGLSMVHGFVEQSGGYVTLTSQVGEGTALRLYLPRAMAEEAQVRAQSERPPGLHRTGLRALVVEDDASVRATVVDMLHALGHEVRVAQCGEDALEVLEREGCFDLLLTDVVLPGDMNGLSLAGEARRRRPGLSVLHMSGYARDALGSGGDAPIDLLVKPFTMTDLERAMDRAVPRRVGPSCA